MEVKNFCTQLQKRGEVAGATGLRDLGLGVLARAYCWGLQVSGPWRRKATGFRD